MSWLFLHILGFWLKEHFVIYSSYHGNISSLVDISSKSFKRLPQGKKDFVHVIPLPRARKNQETSNTENGTDFFSNLIMIFFSKLKLTFCYEDQAQYCEEAYKVLERASQNGRPVGVFISEIVVAAAGVVIPPPGYFKSVYQ